MGKNNDHAISTNLKKCSLKKAHSRYMHQNSLSTEEYNLQTK